MRQLRKTAMMKQLSVLFMLCCGMQFSVFGQPLSKSLFVTVSQDKDDAFPGQCYTKILGINISVSSPLKTRYISKLYFSMAGSLSYADIKSASLYLVNDQSPDRILSTADSAGKPLKGLGTHFSFSVNKPLKSTGNVIWLAYNLSPGISIGSMVDAVLDSIVVSDTVFKAFKGNPPGARLVASTASYCSIGVDTGNVRKRYFAGITNVNLGTISNASTDLDQLTRYSFSTTTHRNESIPISIKTGSGYDEQVTGWADWNNDGIFDASTEQLFYVPILNPGTTFSTRISVPCSASDGKHIVRLVSDLAGTIKNYPCRNSVYGDAEEYTIEVLPMPKPVFGFAADTPTYVGSPVNFTNLCKVTGSPKYEWDFNNDGYYDSVSISGRYIYYTTGWKKIKLRITENGCDTTFTKIYTDSILIVTPKGRTRSDFVADKNNTDTKTPIRLMDASTRKPSIWVWKITPDTVNGVPAYSYIDNTILTSQNPSVQFNVPGNYTVSLLTANSLGVGTRETKTNYISVKDGEFLCHTGAPTDTIHYLNGTLYDDGGNRPYSNNGSCFLIIKPPCADEISVTFNSFDVSIYQNGLPGFSGDYLKVYDGINNKGFPLHDSAGYPAGLQNQPPNNTSFLPPVLKAKSGALYIEWYSDNLFNGEGFKADWNSTIVKTKKPAVSFTAPDTIYEMHPVLFTNTSTGNDVHFYWDFDGNGKIESITTTGKYQYPKAGIYSVKLIGSNCGGADTFVKKIVILQPKSLPVVNFITPFTRVSAGDLVTLTDLSTQKPYKWKWTITSNFPAAPPVYSFGTADSQNIGLIFSDTGHYSVQLEATNSLGKSILKKTNYIAVYRHCSPTVTLLNTDVGISNVILTFNRDTILKNNSPVGNTGYTVYPSKNPPKLYNGGFYTILISRNTSFSDMTGRVLIDLNQDGEFTSANELMVSQQRIIGTYWGGTFTIPANTPPGITHLRVITNVYGKLINPCGANLTGETEDYTVYVGPDTIRPVIILNGKDTIKVQEFSGFHEPGVTATDNLDGNISKKATVTGSVDTTTTGYYSLDYNVTDNTGNKAKPVRRVVQVFRDTTAPQMALVGLKNFYVEVHHPFVDPGGFAVDNLDGPLPVVVTGSVDTGHIGYYPIKYTSVDSRNNIRTITRMVKVGDTTRPVVSLLGGNKLALQILVPFHDPYAIVSDNYTRNPSIKITGDTVNYNRFGTYNLYYTSTDSAGNVSLPVRRQVVITDNIAPILKKKQDTIFWDVYQDYNYQDKSPFTITDNYFSSDKCFLVHKGFVDVNRPRNYSLVYAARDSMNNESAPVGIVVKVLDRVPPQIILNDPPVVYVKQWDVFHDPGYNTVDNVDYDTLLKIVYGGTFVNTSVPGLFYRTYQLVDRSGNMSDIKTRYIVVESAMGIEKNNDSADNISIFPSPAVSTLYVSYHGQNALTRIRIRDISGREVLRTDNPVPKGITKVDVSRLASGVYTLDASEKDSAVSRIFIIAR